MLPGLFAVCQWYELWDPVGQVLLVLHPHRVVVQSVELLEAFPGTLVDLLPSRIYTTRKNQKECVRWHICDVVL